MQSIFSALLRVRSASVFLLWLVAGSPALAADHFISANETSFDGSIVDPGDTVTLAAGSHRPLAITDLTGTAERPIIIRNDTSGSGPAVITLTSGGGFVFRCDDCVHVVIDGSGKWQGASSQRTYGIQITMTGGSPQTFLRVGGLSHHVTIRHVEVDGKWPGLANSGAGIGVNDHEVKQADHRGIWREAFLGSPGERRRPSSKNQRNSKQFDRG